MKYNKILSLLLSFALAVGFVACTDDATEYYPSKKNDNPEREHMTHFRIEMIKMIHIFINGTLTDMFLH